MQLSLFSQPTGVTIQRGDLWWTGVTWSADERMAIGLHGDEILQSELSRYFAGENVLSS